MVTQVLDECALEKPQPPRCGHLFTQVLDECALEKPQPPRCGHLFTGIRAPVGSECVRAAEIVGQYARSPLDLLKLWPSKRYVFSASGDCVIAYAVANGTAIALGDPVGPEAEIEPTTRRFVQLYKKERWAVAFYRTLPDFLPTYRQEAEDRRRCHRRAFTVLSGRQNKEGHPLQDAPTGSARRESSRV